jgi:hypothetical protein
MFAEMQYTGKLLQLRPNPRNIDWHCCRKGRWLPHRGVPDFTFRADIKLNLQDLLRSDTALIIEQSRTLRLVPRILGLTEQRRAALFASAASSL